MKLKYKVREKNEMLNLSKIKEIIIEGMYKNIEHEQLIAMDRQNNIKLDYIIVHMYL